MVEFNIDKTHKKLFLFSLLLWLIGIILAAIWGLGWFFLVETLRRIATYFPPFKRRLKVLLLGTELESETTTTSSAVGQLHLMSDNLQSYRNSILGIQKSPNFASFYRFDKYRTSLMRENCDLLYSYKSEMLEIYDQKSPFSQFVSHLNLDAIALSSAAYRLSQIMGGILIVCWVVLTIFVFVKANVSLIMILKYFH